MSRTDPQFLLRLPAELLKKLRALAKAEGRSVTAQIVHMLTFQLRKP